MEEVRITTIDNPFNPFTEWDEWFNFDLQKGYRTCEQLASITFLSDQLSDSENNETVDAAITQLMKTGAIAKDGIKKFIEETQTTRKKLKIKAF